MAVKKLQEEPLAHIGIVVKDLDKVIESWSSQFGIGPWKVGVGGTDTFKLKVGTVALGPVQLEVIQPLEGRDLWSDFLDKNGEGLHHLAFFVDDIDAEVKGLTAQGAKKVFGLPGRMAYLEPAGPGGVIFEMMRRRPKTT